MTRTNPGAYEVYVREFLLGSDGKPEPTGKHQISNGGGWVPQWRDDGKELFYFASRPKDGDVGGDRHQAGLPILARQDALSTARGHQHCPPAVTGDGKRFLVAVPVSQSGPQQFTVVQNWQAGLKK